MYSTSLAIIRRYTRGMVVRRKTRMKNGKMVLSTEQRIFVIKYFTIKVVQ